MSDTSKTALYHNNPHGRLRRPFLLGWTVSDVAVAIVITTVGIVVGQTSSGFFGWITGGLLTIFLVRTENGRGYREILGMLKDLYIFLFLRDKLYIDPDKDSGSRFVRFLRQKRFRRPSNRYVVPLRIAIVDSPKGQRSIIQQLDRGYDHMVIMGDGSDHLALEAAEQHNAANALAEATDLVAAQTALKIGTSHVRMTRPADTFGSEKYFALNGQPVVFHATEFKLDEITQRVARMAEENYHQILATQRAHSVAMNRAFTTVTIKRTREMNRAMQAKTPYAGLESLQIFELADAMVDAIKSVDMLRVRNVRCGSFLELCQVLRASFDITHQSFQNLSTMPPSDDAEYSDEHDDSEVPALKLPFEINPTEYIEVGNDYICIDGNWISCYRVKRQPEKFSIQKVQSAYHTSIPAGVWTSMASAGETISGDLETNILVYRQAAAINIAQASPIQSLVPHPSSVKRKRQLKEEADRMSTSSYAQRYNDIGFVIADSKEKMIAHRGVVMGAMRFNGYPASIVTGRHRQYDAYITAAFGIHRL